MNTLRLENYDLCYYFPCYNFLISIRYALHIVIAFGAVIGTVIVCDLELQSRWILSQDTGYRTQDRGSGYFIFLEARERACSLEW